MANPNWLELPAFALILALTYLAVVGLAVCRG